MLERPVQGPCGNPAPSRLCGIALLIVSAALAGCSSLSAPKPGRAPEGVPVVVAAAVQKTVPIEIQVVGNVEAYSSIGIKSLVGGVLTQVSFQEGDFVKEGDLLFTIDPRPFQATANQARANLTRDLAQLKQAEANLKRDIAQEQFARAQAARAEKLFQEKVMAAEQVEQYRSDAEARGESVSADRAAIESATSLVAADRAALESAEIQLSYTTIRSPLDGRTGNLNMKQGSTVKANDVDLVTINKVRPIYVTFSVPETRLPAIKKQMAQGKLEVVATPPTDATAQEQGVLTFLDNAVDATTGTIKLKATFPNTDQKLWPGQFVQVILQLTSLPHAVVVPAQAIQTGQEGQFVFVVKEDRTVEMRTVVSGPRADQEMVVEKGLESGEKVVTEGQLRLVPGIRVQIKNPGESRRTPPAGDGLRR